MAADPTYDPLKDVPWVDVNDELQLRAWPQSLMDMYVRFGKREVSEREVEEARNWALLLYGNAFVQTRKKPKEEIDAV